MKYFILLLVLALTIFAIALGTRPEVEALHPQTSHAGQEPGQNLILARALQAETKGDPIRSILADSSGALPFAEVFGRVVDERGQALNKAKVELAATRQDWRTGEHLPPGTVDTRLGPGWSISTNHDGTFSAVYS